MPHKFLFSLKSLESSFWILQIIQMIERLAYAALVLQMAVYISQKDLVGGLHLEHTDKGIIFFFWALIQNLTPVFLGGLADKFGRKRLLIISILIAVTGYFATAFQRDFYPFLFSVIIIGFGLGLYRPALYGLIASKLNDRNSSLAWGINVMLINFAVFFSPPLAKYLESISWNFFFIGLGIILILSLIPVFLLEKDRINLSNNNTVYIKDTFSNLLKPGVIYIILILSGFMMIYMQFYETLPNFIYDWVDTSVLVTKLNLPAFMTMKTEMGIMIDFKWLYNLNSGFIIIAVVFVNWLLADFKVIYGLITGIVIASIGITVSGFSQAGSVTVIGMLIYTLGEMITNPKFNQYMSSIAPDNKKSAYMGFISLSMAIGLGGGSLLGGYLYKNFAEKSGLAMKYLEQNFNISDGINHSNSMEKLMEITNSGLVQATDLLWNTYNPHYIWLVFLSVGILSALLLLLYILNKNYKI